jgi:hypothetical protein
MSAPTTMIIADDHPLFRAALHQAVVRWLPDATIVEAGSVAALEEAADAHCAEGRRSARLSVLPDPAGGNRAVVASARLAWQTPEMERIARLGMHDYLTSHGMADQPMEELAVH